MTGITPPKTASDYFGAMGFEYDSLIHRSVPRYDAIIETLIDYLPSQPETVLELGCGSGALSLSLVKYAPNCKFTFVDASGEMIEITRARLQEVFQIRYGVRRSQQHGLKSTTWGLTSSMSSHRQLVCIT